MISLENIPHKPGCYLHKDKNKKILYIGKAKDLKKRVSSYFQKNHQDEKTRQLVAKIDFVDFIVTDTETEALLLENNLIKKHQPKYNIDLKDARRYAYLHLTDEEYPRLIIARKRGEHSKTNNRYFGPFVSGSHREDIRTTLIKTFKIRTCRKLPKKECLRYHINLCDAPCTKKITKAEYNENIKNTAAVLSGKTNELLLKLKKQMQDASQKMHYEKAIQCKNQISALNYLSEKQSMERLKTYNEDIIKYLVKEHKVYLMIFNVHRGILENKQEFTFDYYEDWFDQFLMQYYDEHDIPKEIITGHKISTSLLSFLEMKRREQKNIKASVSSKITITIPKQGEKKNLLDLVEKNIMISFFGDTQKLEDLQKRLKLHELPLVIECFDISHLSGTATVASMVQFRNGKPDKSNYRRFKIKTVEGIDDFASMFEVVKRRYKRLLEEKKAMPNLIVIDGGKGQLSYAVKALQELNIRIPIISLAKKFEEVYVPGLRNPLHFDKKTHALQLLQSVRDEAHRFAITYNRLLRKKKIKEEKIWDRPKR